MSNNQNSGIEQTKQIRQQVETSLSTYLKKAEESQPNDLYKKILQEVEKPMLKTIMKYTQGNQSKAANVLGLNRGTLRKKLKQYNI